MGEEETELATMSAQLQNIVDRFRLDEFRSAPPPEQLRAAVAAAPLRVDDRPVPVSVSIGAAALGPEVPGTGVLERLLTDADARVYAAKNAGRDRVVAGPLPV
jgi:GGDEF domain-containing protein